MVDDKAMKGEKDLRLPKQLGDFAEGLSMYILGQLWGYRVALVDHTGADIIASKGDQRLAVSVKCRRFAKDDPSRPFELKAQESLELFAREFRLVPAVAFVMILPWERRKDSGKSNGSDLIDFYMLTLAELKALATEPNSGFSKTGNSILHISNAQRNQDFLQSHPERIAHARIEVVSAEKPILKMPVP